MKKLYRPSYCLARNFGIPCPQINKRSYNNMTCLSCVFRDKRDINCNMGYLKYCYNVYLKRLTKIH